MEIINLKTWERTTHYNFFRQMDYPQYSICSNIDITNFLTQVKKRNISFYYAMIYAATYCLNQIKAFKYRIEGDKVILHHTIHPSFTDMSEGSELFKIVTVDMEDTINSFVVKAKKKANNQKDYFGIEEPRQDVTYITCIPWVSFTNMSHTITLNKDDAIPRLAWGKYFKENEKILMPFSLQAHHAFVDGVHMGKYFDVLQQHMNTFK